MAVLWCGIFFLLLPIHQTTGADADYVLEETSLSWNDFTC